MPELLPNRDQSRKLVLSIAIFWAAWALADLGLLYMPVLGATAAVFGVAAMLRFYLTLYAVWEPESGVSAWRMMFVPELSRRRMRADLHIFDLVKPRWIGHTLRETGWPAGAVGFGLLGLLIVDLLLSSVLSTHS